jgi:hypothetical protein
MVEVNDLVVEPPPQVDVGNLEIAPPVEQGVMSDVVAGALNEADALAPRTTATVGDVLAENLQPVAKFIPGAQSLIDAAHQGAQATRELGPFAITGGDVTQGRMDIEPIAPRPIQRPVAGQVGAGAVRFGTVVGGSIVGGIPGAMAAAGVTGAADTHEQVLERLRAQGLPESEVQRRSANAGLLTGGIDAATAGIVPGQPGDRLATQMLISGAVAGGQSAANTAAVSYTTGEPADYSSVPYDVLIGMGFGALQRGAEHLLSPYRSITDAVMQHYGVEARQRASVRRLIAADAIINSGYEPMEAFKRSGVTREDLEVGTALWQWANQVNRQNPPRRPPPPRRTPSRPVEPGQPKPPGGPPPQEAEVGPAQTAPPSPPASPPARGTVPVDSLVVEQPAPLKTAPERLPTPPADDVQQLIDTVEHELQQEERAPSPAPTEPPSAQPETPPTPTPKGGSHEPVQQEEGRPPQGLLTQEDAQQTEVKEPGEAPVVPPAPSPQPSPETSSAPPARQPPAPAWSGSYPEAQQTYMQFKRRLTRAEKSGDPHAVLREVKAFEDHYERPGAEPYPDDWSRWQRAKDDANWKIQRSGLAEFRPKPPAQEIQAAAPPTVTPAEKPAPESAQLPAPRETSSAPAIGDRVHATDAKGNPIEGQLVHVAGKFGKVKLADGTVKVVRHDTVRPAVEQPPKKPITPQVPNEPGVKYVLPSFATQGAERLPEQPKPERLSNFNVGDHLEVPGSLAGGDPRPAVVVKKTPNGVLVRYTDGKSDHTPELSMPRGKNEPRLKRLPTPAPAEPSVPGQSTAPQQPVVENGGTIQPEEPTRGSERGDLENAGGGVVADEQHPHPTPIDTTVGVPSAVHGPIEPRPVAGQSGSERGSDVEQPAGEAGEPAVAKPQQPEPSGGAGVAAAGGRGPGGTQGDVSAEQPAVAAPAEPPAAAPTEADRNHVIKPDDVIAPRGEKGKLTANLRAIDLLKKLEAEDRNPTPDEKRVLAQYTGWGWAGEFFNPSKYPNEHEQIRKRLSDEQLAAAKRSTLNAHYTSPDVIKPMWDLVRRLGFTGGRVLEPAAGIGHFFGLMPKDLQEQSKLVGVELDDTSAAILRKLYPQADVRHGGFQTAKLNNNSVDLAVSNVPFGNYPPPGARDYPKLSIHDYFFARTLDKVKPGGLVAFITSHFTLDKGDSTVRQLLADKADLVGAIRLPNTAFKGNAATEVTTDILVFRKKDASAYRGEPFATTTAVGTDTFTDASGEEVTKPMVVNEYFAKHPDMALGRHSLAGTMRSKGNYALLPQRGADLGEQLNKAIEGFPANVFGAKPADLDVQGEGQEAAQQEKEYSHVLVGDQVLQVRDGKYVSPDWLRVKNFGKDWDKTIEPEVAAQRQEIAHRWLELRKAVTDLLAAELRDESTDKTLAPLREHLNKLYDKYRKDFGTLTRKQAHHEKAVFLSDDPEYPLVQSIENRQDSVDKKSGKTVTTFHKGEIFRKRINEPRQMPSRAKTADDAINISLGYRNAIEPDLIAKLLGSTPSRLRSRCWPPAAPSRTPRRGCWRCASGTSRATSARSWPPRATRPSRTRSTSPTSRRWRRCSRPTCRWATSTTSCRAAGFPMRSSASSPLTSSARPPRSTTCSRPTVTPSARRTRTPRPSRPPTARPTWMRWT